MMRSSVFFHYHYNTLVSFFSQKEYEGFVTPAKSGVQINQPLDTSLRWYNTFLLRSLPHISLLKGIPFFLCIIFMSLSYGTYASPPPSSYVPSAPLATESAPVSIIAPATPNTTETTLPAVPVAEPVATTPVIVQTFFSKQAVFTVINKRTAAREHVTVTSGIGTMSERVEITLHQCSIDKTGIVAEHAALVEIFAPQGVDERASVYKGWLSANHPELTVMVHPEYDITLMRCIEEKAEPLAVTTPEPSPSSPPE